jgi:hypothetical protein
MIASEEYALLNAISDLLEGTLSDAATEKLSQQLAADCAASALYLEFMKFDVDLRWSCSARVPLSPLITDASSALAISSNGNTAEIPRPESHRRTSPLNLAVFQKGKQFLSRPLLRYVAIVALCFYGSFWLLMWNLRGDHDGAAVATVSSIDNCRWRSESDAKAESPSLGEELHYGQSVHLESGTVEIHFARGAKVQLMGPADFCLESEDSARLAFGHLKASVPKEAVGFTVDTPSARVVVLGTEFEVEVTEQGGSEIRVLKGAVETQLKEEVSGSSIGARPARLVAGEGLRVERRGTPPTHLKADATGAFQIKSRLYTIGRSPADLNGTVFGVLGTVCICTEPAAKSGRAYELRFFAKEADRWITPLVFSLDKQGTYTLTGIGESIQSAIAGATNRSPFKLIAGSDRLEPAVHYFGYVDGRIEIENGKLRLRPDRGVADCAEAPGDSGAWIWSDYRADIMSDDFRLGLTWSVNGEKTSFPMRLAGANPEQATHPLTGGRRIAVQLVLEEKAASDGGRAK